MAPKPAKAGSPKKPSSSTSPKSKDGKGKDLVAVPEPSRAEGEIMAAPKSKEEALAQIDVEGLPNCTPEPIADLLGDKYDTLVKVFANYCKCSECKSVEMSTRLKLGARGERNERPALLRPARAALLDARPLLQAPPPSVCC